MKESFEPKNTSPESDINDLKSWLSFDNPNLPEYQKLIRKMDLDENENLVADYSFLWLPSARKEQDWLYRKNKEAFDSLKKGIANSVLVDLGGGGSNIGSLFSLTREARVKVYINVDRQVGSEEFQLDPFTFVFRKDNYVDSGVSVRSVKADMLDFVARMPGGSVNFALNGIDFFVVGDEGYHQALAKEIKRATRPGGIVFGNKAAVFEAKWLEGGEDFDELLVDKPFGFDDTSILRKK